MKKVLYVTYRENPISGNSAIIETQVVSLLVENAKKHLITWLMILTKKDKVDPEKVQSYIELMKNNGVKLIVHRSEIDNFYSGVSKLKKEIKDILRDLNFDVFHCRGYASTYIMNLIRNSEKVIFDMRGVYPQEKYVNENGVRKYFEYIYWSMIEKKCIKRSDKVVTVTEFFKDYIKGKYPKYSDKNVMIYNTVNLEKIYFSQSEREALRNSLSLNNNHCLVVYCGSIKDKWQSFDLIANTYKKLSHCINNTKFLILTRDIDVDIEQYGLDKKDTIVCSVKNTEIFKYLSSADVGLLVRDDSLVNNVAFPVKFTEYMACGLPTVINKSMKGLYELIKNRGIIIDEEGMECKDILKIQRQTCIELCKEKLNSKEIANQYSQLY